MTITELDETTEDLAWPAIRELRPRLADLADFRSQVRQLRTEGYRLLGSADAAGQVVAVAGFRVKHHLAYGRTLILDDLSTLPDARRQGHARNLLAWLDNEARRLGCQEIHLDSGTHRHDAHRRYLSSGFIIPALHFSKPVGQPST